MNLEESNETFLIITWNPPDLGGEAENITGYDVNINTENAIITKINTTAMISGLNTNTEYIVSVAATDKENNTGTPGNLTAVTCE